MKVRLEDILLPLEIARKELWQQRAKHFFQRIEGAFIDYELEIRLLIVQHAFVETYGRGEDLLKRYAVPAERGFLAGLLRQAVQSPLIMLFESAVHSFEAGLRLLILLELEQELGLSDEGHH
jgi:hypothetical protein